MRDRLTLLTASLLLAATAAAAQTAPATAAPPSDSYDALLQRYLLEARAATAPSPGSLWMAGLASDLRARRVNDLLTVRVVENVSGAGTADSNLDKKSSASVGLPSFFGLESQLPGSINPASLLSFGSNTAFQGGGSTARASQLSAVLTVRVEDVLPNGDLLIQGVREIEINGDRQMIVLTGVVRPADVGAGNVIPSTAIGQMQIRYFGRGLIKDNLSPGWLVRVLNKIF